MILYLYLFSSTKFADDKWMVQQGYLESEVPKESEWWWHLPVTSLSLKSPIVVQSSVTCNEAIDVFNKNQIDQMPIVNDKGYASVVVFIHLVTVVL